MCTVCGNATDNVTMCDGCRDETPDKMSRVEFDKQYWGSDMGEVPECTKREFYADYRVSMQSFSDYCDSTTELA